MSTSLALSWSFCICQLMRHTIFVYRLLKQCECFLATWCFMCLPYDGSYTVSMSTSLAFLPSSCICQLMLIHTIFVACWNGLNVLWPHGVSCAFLMISAVGLTISFQCQQVHHYHDLPVFVNWGLIEYWNCFLKIWLSPGHLCAFLVWLNLISV